VFFATKLAGNIAVDIADELGELMSGLYAHQERTVITQIGVPIELKLEQRLRTPEYAQDQVPASLGRF